MSHPRYKLIEPLCKPTDLVDALNQAKDWKDKGVTNVVRLTGFARYVVWSAVPEDPQGQEKEKVEVATDGDEVPA